MADARTGLFLRHLRRFAPPGGDLSDGELLQAFIARRDEAAFTALVRRHGGLVLGAARAVLRRPQDAEDVFQATFLALACQAGAIRRRESLAGWLHGVAYRLALKLRARLARQATVPEEELDRLPALPADDLTWRELRDLLHEELGRLPEKFRVPLILCHLEGLTQDEAARRLGWSNGTLRGRLQRGRELLRSRLARRGLALAAPLLAAGLAQGEAAAVPVTLVKAATQAAALALSGKAAVSETVAALAAEAVPALGAVPWKAGAALALTVALLAGTGLAVHHAAPPPAAAGPPGARHGGLTPRRSPVHTDCYGDPLPPGAVARIGTVRLRHGNLAWSVVFSPDGRRLASTSNDGTARLWDVRTGREVRRFTVNRPGWFWLNGVAFTPDGKTLIAAGADPSVFVWDVATGKEVRRLPGHEGWVQSLALAPDGRTLIASSGNVLHIWDLTLGVELRQVQRPGIFNRRVLAVSPDSKTLAATATDKSIRLFDVAGGGEKRRLPFETHPLTHALAYSPDGKLLAAGCLDKTIRLWDVAAGKERRRLTGHQDQAAAVAFAPDGRTLASAGWDETVRLWDVATGKELRRCQAHSDLYQGMAFAPDGKTLAAAGVRSRVYLWDVATGRDLPASAQVSDGAYRVRFLRDGKTLLSWDGPTRPVEDGTVIRFWDAASGRELGPLPGHTGRVYSLALAAGDERLAVGTKDGKVRLCELPTGKELHRLPGEHFGVAFSPDGRTLITGGKFGEPTFYLWDTATGKELRRLSIPLSPSQIPRLAVTPDGKGLLTDGKDPAIHLWDLATGKELRRFPAGGAAFALSSDGRVLATNAGKRRLEDADEIVLWDLTSGKQMCRFGRQSERYSVLAFSPDGRTLATGDSGAAVHLWELATGQERRLFRGHSGAVESLSFSPDGRRLASAGWDRTALVWSVRIAD